MATGTHDFDDDPHNRDILVSINGDLVKRDQAKVPVTKASSAP